MSTPPRARSTPTSKRTPAPFDATAAPSPNGSATRRREDTEHPGWSALERERANLEACVRCGLCLPACPTYRIGALEEESPRGRIAVALALLDGHIELTPDVVEHQMSCLLCEGCTAVCPAGVEMEHIAVAMREVLAEEHARPWRPSVAARAMRVLGDRPRLERRVRWLGRAQRAGLTNLGEAIGALSKFGMSAASLPRVPEEFLTVDGSGWRPATGPVRGRVELFVGCLMSTLLAPLDVATGELLAAAGYEVVVTTGQTCCGALSAHEGDTTTARELGARNLKAFAGLDTPIVLNSAGCGAFLKEYPHHIGPGSAPLAGRVVDVAELLVDVDLDLSGPPPPGPVAYHDACHARLAQGIIEAPRALLRRIPGIELVELADPTICCGSAGVYNILKPETADELGRRRARSVRDVQARTVVTANPGCLMQVRSHLARDRGDPVAVRHLVEVLRAACPTPVERVSAEVLREPDHRP